MVTRESGHDHSAVPYTDSLTKDASLSDYHFLDFWGSDETPAVFHLSYFREESCIAPSL